MSLSRRGFLAAGAAGLAFSGLARQVQAQAQAAESYRNEVEGYGPLLRDPHGVFDLPEGFEYRIISQAGETMADGLRVPGRFDGMGCFPARRRFGLSSSQVVLVRNHELDKNDPDDGPCGIGHHLIDRLDVSKAYDLASDRPLNGGTTTLVYDLAERRTVRQHLSLTGTYNNCAGGVTPWGSWLSCEETEIKAGDGVGKDHGWIFEVPAHGRGLVEPRPLRAMGRFEHEAACVDPATGVVYLTEDKDDSLFYRFLPNRPGRLHEGGRLQALAVRGAPGADLRNWNGQVGWRLNDWLDVHWIDLDDVESPNGDLRLRGHAAGAALFARGEGLTWGAGELYFTATSGGPGQLGQIIRHVPGPDGGRIQLFIESGDDQVYDYGDNLTVAPWGHLLVCEDRYSSEINHLRGVTPEGRVYTLARNVFEGNQELAGACFSPDGSTLFVNIYRPGLTLAITGPWTRFRNS